MVQTCSWIFACTKVFNKADLRLKTQQKCLQELQKTEWKMNVLYSIWLHELFKHGSALYGWNMKLLNGGQ